MNSIYLLLCYYLCYPVQSRHVTTVVSLENDDDRVTEIADKIRYDIRETSKGFRVGQGQLRTESECYLSTIMKTPFMIEFK